MSSILEDEDVDNVAVSSVLFIPKAKNAANLVPIKGAIAYNLNEDPVGAIWYSNDTIWQKIAVEGIIGFPVTNPPPPALLPDAGTLIFDSSTEEWTVYSITGDVIIDNSGMSIVNSIQGQPIGPFTPLSPNQVLGWDGSTWTNLFPPSAPPTGPAGGALTGNYPNPQLAAVGTSGSYINFQGNQTLTYTVNSEGQVVSSSYVPISNLSPSIFTDTIIQDQFNLPGNTIHIIFSFKFPDGWNQFILYISWIDTSGQGGTYEYSGGLKFLGGQIVNPGVSYGATLKTVFGTTPAFASLEYTPGSAALSFLLRVNPIGPPNTTNTHCQMVYVNTAPL